MSEPHVTGITLPHESFGDAECCGCLYAIKRGDVADLVCNERRATLRTVPVSYLYSFQGPALRSTRARGVTLKMPLHFKETPECYTATGIARF
jgi:hypothetical protein